MSIKPGKSIESRLPSGLRFHHRGSYIEIVYVWRDWTILFTTGFIVFWDNQIYSMIISSANFNVIKIIFVCVSVGFNYYVLAKWLNKTYIFVSPVEMVIQHKPIPWTGNRELQVSKIKNLYIKKKIERCENSISVFYKIYANTKKGKKIELISYLKTNKQALFIKQEVEKYLNIETVKDEI
jgi:hypothetical protein